MQPPRDVLWTGPAGTPGVSHAELWLRYFGLGGMTPALELEAILHGALEPADPDRDRIVHALNERFTELGSATIRSPTPMARDRLRFRAGPRPVLPAPTILGG